MKKFILLVLLGILLIPVVGHSQNNSIEFTSRYENWEDEYSNRIFNSLQYGRKFGEHDLFLRGTTLSRDGQTDFIADMDFYPRYKGGYMYFNFGYSPDAILLPRMRGAGEIYKSLGSKFEASAGFRYVKTIRPVDYNIWSATGTLGVYVGDYFFYGRPTFSFLDVGLGGNFMAVGRRYLANKSYVELSAMYGDDAGANRNFSSIENSFGLQTYLFRAKGHLVAPKNWEFDLGVDYSGIYIAKPIDGEYANIVGVDLTIKKKF
jgi:YaiO family outer membrane protein